MGEIAALNGIADASLIRVGQNLRVPQPTCYQPEVLAKPFTAITWEPKQPLQGEHRATVQTDKPLDGLSGVLGDTPFQFVTSGTTDTADVAGARGSRGGLSPSAAQAGWHYVAELGLARSTVPFHHREPAV